MDVDEKQIGLFKIDKEKVTDQFRLLEQKIGFLIELTEALKNEKRDLIEKLQVQEETLDTLSKEYASLRAKRDKDGHRLVTLLKRVDQVIPDIYRMVA
ncbi:MAG: hypothetical protein ACFFCW_36395 [Candidatus Hodarchaeota archaeon]